MKAIVYDTYGSPNILNFEEVPKPVPGDDDLLIKVHAASINYIDWQMLTGESRFLRLTSGGLRKPKNKILGDDLAGRIEAVGANVKKFQPGDEVFGLCNTGTFAEYRCVAENKAWLAHKPAGVSFEEAAAVPEAGITALQGLRDHGRIRPGQKVLINGASGGVGGFAVQIAKYFGTEVTAVCGTQKMDYVRSIGADHVIDYTQEDFTKNGQFYDLIFSLAGHHALSDYRAALSSEGVYVCAGGSKGQYFQGVLLGPLLSVTGRQKLGAMYARPNQEDLDILIELVEAGKVGSFIDRRYPLSETADAFKYYGEGQVRGKLVIAVDQNGESKN